MEPRRADLETETLYEVAKVLSLSTDLNKAFTSALNLLGLYLGMENGTLSLFDPVTGEVFIEAAPEMVDAERILGRLRPGEGVVGLNNLCSFTDDQERAWEFGSTVWEARVALPRIFWASWLLVGALQGEREALVVGGELRVVRVLA